MNMAINYNDNVIQGKPCSNSKFMHIAGLPGMRVEDSYDNYYHEETTTVYQGDVVMAMRTIGCIHFPNQKPDVSCFIFGYHKGIENE